MAAATRDEAVAKAISFFDLTVASKARYKYVFPVPPGPSMKKAPPSLLRSLFNIKSYAYFCSVFEVEIHDRSS